MGREEERSLSNDREEVKEFSGAIDDSCYGIVSYWVIKYSLIVAILR